MKSLYLKELKFILRPLWFYCLLLFVSFIALAIMPQGNDMMYCIIEDTTSQQIVPLVFLSFTTVYWGLTLYFTAMLILWVADLSSDNLPDYRKDARRNYARNVPQFFLYLPIFILNFSFVKAFLIKEKENDYGYLISVIIVLAILCFFAVRYIYKYVGEKLIKSKYWSKVLLFSIFYFSLNFIILLAIKNDQSPTNYLGYFAALFAFSILSIFLMRQWYAFKWLDRLMKLVKSINPNYNIAPIKSVFRNFYAENVVETTLKDYRYLVKRFLYVVSFSAIVVVGFNFFKISFYEYFGGIGIIIFSFACWGVLYTFVSLYSKIKSFVFSIGLKTVLIALLISSSYFNADHKIRFMDEKPNKNSRESNKENIVEYFDKWAKVKYPNIDSLNEIPVVLIAAEGGAFRTGCYSAYMLNTIQNVIDSTFNQSIFCYSTVSGGTFGCNLYNALCLNKKIPMKDYDTILNRFFSHDYLSPLTAKLAFGEVIGYFSPKYIASFDRMTALERSWEIGLETSLKEVDKTYDFSYLDKGFSSLNPINDYHNPVVLVNTTEINTGKRYIISNVMIDTNYSTAGDFFNLVGNDDIRYSTAIGLSAKFPIVSPAGTFIDKKGNKQQFLDGGYYENKGAQTLYETLTAIMKYSKYKGKVKPIVIQFSFGDKSDTDEKQGIHTFNEISEILAGIYNVRGGHAQNASFYLNRYIQKNTKGSYFEFSPKEFNTHKLPMNWVLSKKAIEFVKADCKMQLPKIDSIKNLLKIK